jgi:hypothetical protein
VTVLINLQRVTLTIHNPDMANGRVGSTPQLPFHNGAKCGIGMNICSVDYWYGFGARFTLGHQPPITGGKLSGCTYGDQTPGNDCVEVMNGPQSVTAQWEY